MLPFCFRKDRRRCDFAMELAVRKAAGLAGWMELTEELEGRSALLQSFCPLNEKLQVYAPAHTDRIQI